MSDLMNVGSTDFQREVLDSKVPVLVDFWAGWCGPCRMVAPVLEKLQKEYEGKMKIVKLDIDNFSEISDKYNVQSIPNMVLFKDGIEVDRIIGLANENTFKIAFDKVV